MLAFAVRGVVLLGVLSWYSATMWKMIDGYFKDQFRTYLQEEYRKYPRMKSDVESARIVDKGFSPSSLPTELNRVAEIYGSDAVCPADIADTCPQATSERTTGAVTGGGSENAAAGAGSTDKNAFPKSAIQSTLESRKLPSGSDTHDEERRLSAINQDNEHEEVAIEKSEIGDGVVAFSASSLPLEKPRRRLDKRKSSASKEISRRKSTKRKVKTIVLTDFAGARISDEDDDFSEFEEEGKKSHRISRKEGVLVSELPFKPKADIGSLDRVTKEEFCPLILEDETSCGETTTWP